MNTTGRTISKLALAALGGLALTGCVAVPVDSGPYGGGYGYAPAAPAIVVAPVFRPYYGFRGHGHRHRHGHR